MRKAAATVLSITLLIALIALPATAQPKSPRGQAATQTGAGFAKWVSVDYSRPILRGRQGIFGEADAYGQKVNAGAPVWRAGADTSTRLKTDVPLNFGGTALPAGEYSLFIALESPSAWTLILSSHGAEAQYNFLVAIKKSEGVTVDALQSGTDDALQSNDLQKFAVFFCHKTCPPVAPEDMSSCGTAKTCLLVTHEDMSSCDTRSMSSCGRRRHVVW